MSEIKKIVFVTMMLAVASVWATGGDMLVSYSTRGTDRYFNGEPVKDGECYALVYTHPGKVFSGFQADGTVADPAASDLALVAPVAKGGRCPPVLFQVREQYASSRQGGAWEVFLIDTRDASGRPAGLDANGRLRRINRWNRVAGRIRTRRGTDSFGALEPTVTPEGALTGGEGAMPPDAPRPRITGITVKNGVVELSVADTVPYATYDVDGAHEMHRLGRRNRVAREAKDGVVGKPIKMEVEMKEGADAPRFFRVFRK